MALHVYWWLLGLLNNTPYVVMLAAAKWLNEGGTAIVYLVNTVPGLLIKATGPYWMHRYFSASQRMSMATACLIVACLLVRSLPMVGVAFVSLQIGLGEASLLGVAGLWDNSAAAAATSTSTVTDSGTSRKKELHCLQAFASGTGLAGPLGYFWKMLWVQWWGFKVETCLQAMLLLAALYGWAFFQAQGEFTKFMHHCQPSVHSTVGEEHDDDDEAGGGEEEEEELQVLRTDPAHSLDGHHTNFSLPTEEGEDRSFTALEQQSDGILLDDSTLNRFQFVKGLWPYTIPLFAVYAAEYALQSGCWTAIGFPLTSVEARARFYQQSNWLYQAGTFVARSSGLCLKQISVPMLWFLPFLQIVNLVAFTFIAANPGSLLYRSTLLLIASFYAGLLGGTVYIHGYLRIRKDYRNSNTELALFSACVAEALGVLVADVLGLFLQSCLYETNGMGNEAAISCPVL